MPPKPDDGMWQSIVAAIRKYLQEPPPGAITLARSFHFIAVRSMHFTPLDPIDIFHRLAALDTCCRHVTMICRHHQGQALLEC